MTETCPRSRESVPCFVTRRAGAEGSRSRPGAAPAGAGSQPAAVLSGAPDNAPTV